MVKTSLLLKLIPALLICLILTTTSVWQPVSDEDVIRPYTRPYEFNYFYWTLDALIDKVSMAGFGFNHYLSFPQENRIVSKYFMLLQEKERLENSVESIFSDPEIENPDQVSHNLQIELSRKSEELEKQSSLAEVIIQGQVSAILSDMQLTKLGQPFPPVLYHATDLPKELIISPRNVIEQAASISLNADIDINETVKLEEGVEERSNYSALVVPIGGVGTYPTMVIRSENLSFLIETVAHEWIHNYLVFKPLGLHYSASPELRTMNETTASIAGEEISQAVIQKFYPYLLKPAGTPAKIDEVILKNSFSTDEDENIFNFNQEMYQTRIRVDELLLEGKIQEAENYMEEQRQVFWKNGYSIRKLNQAYFAFHGAYADQPYGAAGEDPVGAAVRVLRFRSASLTEFIQRISSLSSEDQLYTLINSY
jgi:hypothetical protein